MISWIQTTFQKHIKLVLVLLLVAVVVPFVFTIGAMPGLGQADRTAKSIDLFGVKFTSDAERQAFFGDAQLSYLLAAGQQFYDPNQVQMHAFRRGAALEMANQLGVPQPKPDQVTEFIKTLPGFRGQDGNFDAGAYTRFRDEMATNPQISQSRPTRVLAEDWRVAEVSRLLGGPGYVLKSEVEQALARADTRWTVASATLDLTKIETTPEPTEEELRTWFESHSGNYRIPERMKVNYVRFPASRYTGRVDVKDEEITRYFEQNRARYTPPPPQVAEGETPPPPAEVNLADVRDRVVADFTAARARTLAEKAAADFAYLLFDKKITPGTEAFNNVLEAQNLKLESPDPFAATETPAGTGWNPQVVSEAFKLGAKRLVSDPLTAGGDALVLFFDERIAPADAELFAVRDRVLADVKANKRREAISARGENLRSTIAAEVKAGAAFSEVAKTAGLETKQWENFSLRELPPDIDYSVLGRIEDLSVNEVSPMAVQGDKGTLLMISQREAPKVSTDDGVFEEARNSMMRQGASVTEQGLLGGIVEKALKTSGLARETDTE